MIKYPWTNLNQLNLNWIVSQIGSIKSVFRDITAQAFNLPAGSEASVTVTGGDTTPFNFNFGIPLASVDDPDFIIMSPSSGIIPTLTIYRWGRLGIIYINSSITLPVGNEAVATLPAGYKPLTAFNTLLIPANDATKPSLYFNVDASGNMRVSTQTAVTTTFYRAMIPYIITV